MSMIQTVLADAVEGMADMVTADDIRSFLYRRSVNHHGVIEDDDRVAIERMQLLCELLDA